MNTYTYEDIPRLQKRGDKYYDGLREVVFADDINDFLQAMVLRIIQSIRC
jgi:hypothetical protein